MKTNFLEIAMTVDNSNPLPKQRAGFFGGAIVGVATGVLMTVVLSAAALPNGARSMMMHKPGEHFGGGRHEMMIDFVLTKIDATDMQQQQIRAILDDARADFKAERPDKQVIKAKLEEIFSQPQVDRAELEALRLTMLAKASTGSERALQVVGDISDVLTQEQRAELLALHDKLKH